MTEKNQSFGSLLPTLYQDAAQPAVRSAGKALGGVADLIFNPIGRGAEILEKNALKFLDKFDGEDPANIVAPAPNVAFPILQKLAYTEAEELVEFYTELLKKGCLKDSQDKVLPSYVNIISSLTPDEARIIDYMFKEGYVVKFRHDQVKDEDRADMQEKDGMLFIQLEESLPFIEVKNQKGVGGSGWRVAKYFTDIAHRVSLRHPENLELYFENLQAMGIFEIRDDAVLQPSILYSHLSRSAELAAHKEAIEKDGRMMGLQWGSICFTSLGLSFLASCTRTHRKAK